MNARAWIATAAIVSALAAGSVLAAYQIDNIDQDPATTTTVDEWDWACGQLAHDTPISCWVGP